MSKFKRQPEQQQQQSLASYQCPGCKQPMRLVGRESVPGKSRSRAAHLSVRLRPSSDCNKR